MADISNMFGFNAGNWETSSRSFYDFNKKAI